MIMTNESAISKCAECGQTAHTSATCKNGRVGIINLFGVMVDPQGGQVDDIHQLDDDGTIRKCKSMEIINLCNNENTSMDCGYYSDEHGHGNGKKKGVVWTEKEHKLFLIGLENLGKGDWKGISKKYVTSRTPTQVASHAQKYFIRISASQDPEKGKRRSSLFDMPVNKSFVAPTPTPIAPTATPMAPPNNFVRPPVPRTSNYDVRDYSYMLMGYLNSSEKTFSDQHFSPMLSFLPVMSFPKQNYAYPYNGNWNQRFITGAPYVTQPKPITQGEPMIIEVIDDDE